MAQLASPFVVGLPAQRRLMKHRLCVWCIRACCSPSSSSCTTDEALTFDGTVKECKTRLDIWLASQLPPHVSRARVQSSIRSGLALVNGQPVDKVSYAVRNGDHIKCAIAALAPLKAEPENIALDILFEDNHVLVVNKPAHMVTHPAPGNWNGTLVNALVHHCELPVAREPPSHLKDETFVDEIFVADSEDDDFDFAIEELDAVEMGNSTVPRRVPLAVRPGIVHRLDKGTSGLLVVAKDEHAHEHLSKQFKDRTVKRSYLSLTCGALSNQRGRINVGIGRDSHNRTRMAVVPSSSTNKRGRPAASSYEVVEVLANGGSALVEWRLETGRTHQIRVHAQHLSHPLLGDDVYGGTKGAALACLLPKVSASKHGVVRKLVSHLQRPYLHAATLGFIHPQSDEKMAFTCPPPQDFEELFCQLKSLGNT